jgi:hypothetical protein
MTRVRYTRPAYKIKDISLHLHTASTLGICGRTDVLMKVMKPVKCGVVAISVCLK